MEIEKVDEKILLDLTSYILNGRRERNLTPAYFFQVLLEYNLSLYYNDVSKSLLILKETLTRGEK